jgi:hypothetical protein
MPATVTDTVTRDNLILSGYPLVKTPVTIADGETIVRGGVIGIVTASGHGVLLDIAAVDGSQNFYGIALEDVTTSGATQVTTVAIAGKFNSQGLSYAGATVLADILDDARDKNCYIVSTDSGDNVVGG